MRRALVIDGQVFQTPAWHRGMGKYSLELIAALDHLNQSSERWNIIEVVFSKHARTKNAFLEELSEALGKKIKFTVLDLHMNEYDNRSIAQLNRTVMDEHIKQVKNANALDEVDFLVLSLMQSEVAPAFSSLLYVHNVLLFYDLIPLMLHKIYLTDPLNRKVYLSKLAELFKADTYLTISKTVANDLSLYLGIDPSHIHNIDGGPIKHATATKPLKIKKPFILMPTGNDLRKNNGIGIQGFDMFNKANEEKYKLVITSSFKDHEVNDLKRLSKHVIFTGNIDGEELDYLYQEMDALLFPSEYEGLGLPILEALEKNKPVACSNISVFREMSKTAFQYFDPSSATEIANALQQTITQHFSKSEYKAVTTKYTWEHTAKKTIEILSSSRPQKRDTSLNQVVSIFTPDPSLTVSAAKFAQTCHAESSQLLNIHYFIKDSQPVVRSRINYLTHVTNPSVLGSSTKTLLNMENTNIYNIENDPACAEALFTALAIPGIVILHSVKLEKVWESLLTQSFIHSSRYELERTIQKNYETTDVSMLVSLLADQRAIIVFTNYAYNATRAILTKMKSTTAVYKLAYPVSELVYSDVLPSARSGNLAMAAQQAAEIMDFEAYNDMDKASFSVWDISDNEIEMLPRLLETMAHGVVPVLPENIWASEFPEGLVLRKKNIMDLSDIEKEVKAKSQQILEYIRQNHGSQKYAERLKEIIKEVMVTQDERA